jgi:chromosome segregation protein
MTNRLLSLELQGYKTFASSTSFEFPGQVTAIVGPNGSGKSNIGDAVRWVLGEQAYSLLRGKKTEDMIFSGSQQRSRASMASVSIRFNNEDGWLPVDFSEVVITRRAYRSGENEYLLNNQRVRLKEINELLANSGLGERNYTIIGQGLIDNALSLKPDERRKFIEEAAGIDLYRSRREDATQKLDKTLRNMERANDILSELKPRLNALARSKEKTTQYKQVQSDLSVLLKDWYGYHWHQSQKELREAREFYSQQKSQFDEAKIEIDRKESELNQVQGSLHQNRARLADLHKQISNYHLEIEEITKNTAVLDEREKTVKERIAELENEIEITKSQRENYREELINLEKQGKNIHSDLESATQSFLSAEEIISRKIDEKTSLEGEIGRIRKEILARQSHLLDLNSRVTRFEIDIQQYKTEITELERFLKRTENELKEANSRKTELQKKLEELKLEQQEKSTLADQLESELKNTTDDLRKLGEEKQEKGGYLSTISAELRVLKDAEERLEGFSSGSAAILSAVQEKKFDSRISAILQHLEVPEKFEQAIAAGLGDMLEGVVLEERKNTGTLLQFLEANRIARTSIFTGRNPQDNAIEDIKFNLPVTYAESVVYGDGHATKLVKELLSRTVIVNDRMQALELYEQIKPGWKLVTLIGEVFDSNGVVTAGTGNRAQPIKRKREKKHLENEVSSIGKELSRIETDLTGAKLKVTDLQTQLAQVKNELKRLQDQTYARVMDIQRLELENDQKQKISQNENNRLQNLKGSIASTNDQIISLRKEIDIKKKEIESLEPSLDESAIILLNTEIETMRKEMLELSSRKAVADELNSRQNESIRFLQVSTKRTEDKLTELNELLSNQRRTLTDTSTTKTSLGLNYDELTEKIELVNTEISPLEARVESIIGQQGEIIQDVDESRKQFAIVERHTMQTQMKVDKLQSQLDFLKQKIAEDFGLISDYEGSGFYADQPLPLDDIVTQLPKIEELGESFEAELNQKKSMLRRLGPVNPDADKEYEEVNERYTFLVEQLQDLEKAEADLRQVMRELDELMEKKFTQTFIKVNEEFKDIFGQLFNGGSARLMIADEQNVLDSGIEIEATLPGKRRQELALLSGGERSLTAVALIFALLRISPTPFCILDEVDAMLDESNVVKFGEMLGDLSDSTQFIVITHNRNTVQLADILYGVTMGKDSVSQVISLKMDELTEEMVQ